MIKEGGRKHLHPYGGGNRVPERSATERSRGWPMRENSDHCHHNTTAAAFLLHPPSRQHDHHHTIIIETTTMTYQVDDFVEMNNCEIARLPRSMQDASHARNSKHALPALSNTKSYIEKLREPSSPPPIKRRKISRSKV
eukprot:scaffold24405_cov59-Skeletonema_menzelii.AAC.1